MIEGLLGSIRVGDLHPVRIMAVINLSKESFYSGSVASPDEALFVARALAEEGADLIDVGAVSTAPGSPCIGESQEKERLIPALRSILDNLEISVSVDTQRAILAEQVLSMGAVCINDVSGLGDPEMAKIIADHDASAVVMASRKLPGDVLTMDQILQVLGERVSFAEDKGVGKEKIIVDPGVGKWIPEKTPEHDLAILDGFSRLRVLGRPIITAISRKSFIGARLNLADPSQRLHGSLAATAIAIYNGAHVVRTHDVSLSLETIHMAQAIRGRPARAEEKDICVEVWGQLGGEGDLEQALRRIEVDPGGYRALCRKGAFRVLSVRGSSSIEAVIIKQEMLARGGDAAIPKLALRCDPGPQQILILGTLSQISGLVGKLKEQPFRLPSIGIAIEAALDEIADPKRYR